MNRVTVLKEGYAFNAASEGESGTNHADCTITLVRSVKKNIIIDTGLPIDKNFLIHALKEQGLSVDDIDVVVGTHGHSDHIGNIGLFPSSLLVVSCDVCRGDTYYDNDLSKGVPYVIDTDVEVIFTPGHTGRDVSVVVRNTELGGNIVVAGDLFESEADIEQSSKWMDISENPVTQAIYRSQVIQCADYIIPGHGPMFKVTEKHKQLLRLKTL